MLKKIATGTLAASLLFTGTALNTTATEKTLTTSATQGTLTDPVIFASEGAFPAFHPNGKTLITMDWYDYDSHTATNSMYNVETGERIKEFQTANDSGVYEFSPNGTYIVSSGDHTTVRDGATAEELYTLDYRWGHPTFHPANEHIAAFIDSYELLNKNHFAVVNLQTQEILYQKDYETSTNMRTALHPTEPLVAVVHGRDVQIFNYEKGELVTTIANPFNVEERHHYHAITDLTYSPDGGRLFLISSPKPDQMVVLDSTKNYSKIALTSTQYANKPFSTKYDDYRAVEIRITPNQKELYTRNHDGIKFYSLETGAMTHYIEGQAGITSFANNMNMAIEREFKAGTKFYIEVVKHPYKARSGNGIQFEDTHIQLNTGQSTFYGVDYYNNGEKSLLTPSEVTFTSNNPDVVAVSPSGMLVAKSEGSTKITATYNGYTDEMNVHVRDLKPSAIKIDYLKDSSYYITGTFEPNTTVYTMINARSYSVNTDSTGRYSFYLDKPLVANMSIRVHDTNGNEQYTYVLRDTIAPGVPAVTTVNDSADTVTGRAEPLSTVKIQVNTSSAVSVKADASGKFTKTFSALTAGHSVNVKAQDRSGNISKPKTAKVADKTPPPTPKVNSLTTASTKVSGTAENKAKIYVVINKKTYSGTSVNGKYSITIPKQKRGTKVYVYAKDLAGNRSKTNAIVTVK